MAIINVRPIQFALVALLVLLITSTAVAGSPRPQVSAMATETIIHRFSDKITTYGQTPLAGVTVGKNGALFGVTQNGGLACKLYPANGCGTVYELTPPAAGQTIWNFKILYKFK